MNELELFEAALAIVDPIERRHFLDQACIARPDLRQRLDRLLAAHFQSHAVLDQAIPLTAAVNALALKPTQDFQHDNDRAGTVIAGKYTLVEVIGEGGMGSVWRAKQTEPVKRFVAVKLIKAGMDSKQVLARFDAERQALALMDHPHIAKVLDGGLHRQRPFFVMELVKGVPITEYCDARKLTPKERLGLFVPVCQAIQHAHQKGIIHRDIKPNNVLIAMYDDQPVVKVIDFGVAKATGGTLTEQTIDTGFGAVVGTPQYMSPEQATFNNLDIDTRSDVYALGVLLYELLTGSPPFAQKDLEKKGLLEILRVVREEEPPRPSTKLSTAEALPTLSANRGTDPKQLTGLLKNELDWIVMRALEKDRARRYETAAGFAADVLRYLNGEAVQAHPPTPAYRLRKFIRRNQLQVVGTSFVLLSLLAGIVGTSFGLLRAEQRRSEAERAHEDERKQRRIAEAKTVEAQEHEAEANRARRETLEEKFKSDIKSISLQMDFDLIECQTDLKVGLLNLSRQRDTSFEFKTWNIPGNNGADLTGDSGDGYEATSRIDYSHRPDYRVLREFATAAVIATGQQYTSLLPPIPGAKIEIADETPNLLSLDENGVPRLFELRSGREIAELRVGDEQIVNCGFSPDGRWAFTDDLTSILRIWDARSGKLVSALAPRENRYGNPAGAHGDWRKAVLVSGNRVITRRCIVEQMDIGDGAKTVSETWAGPVELWDMATGQCISRLDNAGTKIEQFHFEGDGEFLPILENPSVLRLYAAENGRETARFTCPNNRPIEHYAVSSSGNRVAVVSDKVLRVWNSRTREENPQETSLELPNVTGIQFVSDDLIRVKSVEVFGPERELYFQPGRATPVVERTVPYEAVDLEAIGPINRESWLRFKNTVYDGQTGLPFTRPANRKYHPLLAKFTKDGRFVWGARWRSDGFTRYQDRIAIDTVTEKSISLPFASTDPAFVSKLGWVWQTWMPDTGNQPCFLPSQNLDAIPWEVLQQWAQLAVRGELATDGTFTKWNAETWELKRQQLAAVPRPIKDFPFPGHLAHDKLHWLRGEFNEAENDSNRLRWAEQLLDKATSLGDQAEMTRWRNETKRLAGKLAKSAASKSESADTKKSPDKP